MAFFHSLTSWSNFHSPIFEEKQNQFTKCLGPSLGVNRMWTKTNECVDFFNICSKKGSFEKKFKKFKFNHSLDFIFSSPKKFHRQSITFLCGSDNIPPNILGYFYISSEYVEYSNNIPRNISTPTEHCYGCE